MNIAVASAAPRSTFITVFAWCGIGFTVLSILGGLAMATFFWWFNTVMPMEELMQTDADMQNTPMAARFILSHLVELMLGGTAYCVVALVAAIGLLKRMDWARVVMVFLLTMAIAWGLLLLVLEVHGAVTAPAQVPAELPVGMRGMMRAMNTFNIVVSILKYSALFALSGWLIKKLLSEEVRGEFS